MDLRWGATKPSKPTCDSVTDTPTPVHSRHAVTVLGGRTVRAVRQYVRVTVRDVERLDLEAQPASVSEARRFVRKVLGSWGYDEAIDTAALLTSELATNAVLHARTRYAVLVAQDDDHVRIEVLDGSAVPPRARVNSPTAATGRGVAMVDRLAAAWGATPPARLHGFAKGVWFTVPLVGSGDSSWGDWAEGL